MADRGDDLTFAGTENLETLVRIPDDRHWVAIERGIDLDLAVDLFEELDIVDVGGVFVIPSSIEKTFDQIGHRAG